MNGLIFDIKKYAINDGPGIRLTVFFKGCNLSCQWCHNPESMSPRIQKLYTASKCIGVQECVTACPNDALRFTREGIVTDFDICELCGKCAEVCPTKAFEMLGKSYGLQELMSIIDNEAIFFDQSGGGVTFSGGEPLMHAEFLIKALKACGDRYYHRVVDTTAFARKELLEEVAHHTDLFLIDLKHMDTVAHKRYTGVGNEKILRNIERLAAMGKDMIFRMPLIKDVNTTSDNIQATVRFIKSLDLPSAEINLLPYHNIAQMKYAKLGSTFEDVFQSPELSEQEDLISIFENAGIKARLGG